MAFTQSSAIDQLHQAMDTAVDNLESALHDELADKFEEARDKMIARYDAHLGADEIDLDVHQFYRDGAGDMLNTILELLA